MPEHRRFYRHPTEIPIEVWQVSEADLHLQHLHNVSLGGLAFESETDLMHGALIGIRILVRPPFTLFGKVVWCRKNTTNFEVGVEFIEKNQSLKEEMVDEVCQIEMYKQILVRIAEITSDEEVRMLRDSN